MKSDENTEDERGDERREQGEERREKSEYYIIEKRKFERDMREERSEMCDE